MPSKIIIRNPFLNALMYDVCYNLPDEVKAKLKLNYRRILASPLRTKFFCEKSSMDEKLMFFAAVGIHNAITIFPDRTKNGVSLKQIIQKYSEERLAAASKDHAIMNVFVTTDKETQFLLGLMAMNIHTKSFILNLDYNKVGYHFKEWTKRMDNIDAVELQESVESAEAISTALLNHSLCLRCATTDFGLNSMDIDILFYLYINRQSYISRDRVWEKFAGYVQRKSTTTSLKKLLQNDYIRKHADWRKLQYTITSEGIDVVNKFIQRVLNMNKFV